MKAPCTSLSLHFFHRRNQHAKPRAGGGFTQIGIGWGLVVEPATREQAHHACVRTICATPRVRS